MYVLQKYVRCLMQFSNLSIQSLTSFTHSRTIFINADIDVSALLVVKERHNLLLNIKFRCQFSFIFYAVGFWHTSINMLVIIFFEILCLFKDFLEYLIIRYRRESIFGQNEN